MTIRTVFRWVAWGLVAAVTVFTLCPIEVRPVTGAPADLERFLAFAITTGAFCLAYPRNRLGVILLAIAFTGALELAQHLVPGRHGRLHDAVAKASGAFIGVAMAMFIARWKEIPTVSRAVACAKPGPVPPMVRGSCAGQPEKPGH